MTTKPIRLHLGCGANYLEGYTNVDLPPQGQTVMKAKADVYQDIRTLQFADNTVDEIRTHHLFEHFTRQEALKILFQWRRWLKPNGLLFIETPDFETGARDFIGASLAEKFRIARHLFGSQESDWALHKDFFGKEKFAYLFEKLGFVNPNIESKIVYTSKLVPDRAAKLASIIPGVSHRLHNVIAKAHKGAQSIDERAVAREVLSLSLLGKEEEILEVWLKDIFG